MTVNQQQSVWRALFHPTRRQIIKLLQERSRTTGELSNFFDVTRYAVMKHLRVLEQAGLIHVQREGRLRWNVLNPERLQDIPADYLEKWPKAGKAGDSENEVRTFEGNVTSSAYELTLPAPPQIVYRAFLDGINNWWPDRELAGSAVIFENFVGGRFYETSAGQEQGVLFGFITCLRPNREIRFIGPLDAVEEAAVSAVRILFEEVDGHTQLHLTHRAVGEVSPSLHTLHPADWDHRLNHHLRTHLTA